MNADIPFPMRSQTATILIALFVASISFKANAAESPAEKSKPTDRDIEAQVKAREERLACVTPKAFPVPYSFIAVCMGPTHEQRVRDAPHGWHYLRIYVSPVAKQPLLDGKADFPVGTVVVKEKSHYEETTLVPDFYTAMLKREPGFDPKVGDWEFLVLDGKARVTARGKIESCAECHQKFQRTGYLSRVYLPEGPSIR